MPIKNLPIPSWQRDFLILGGVMLFTVTVFRISNMDPWLAARFYQPDSPTTPWPVGEHALWSFLNDFVPFFVVLLILGSLITVALAWRRNDRLLRANALLVLLTLLMGPGLVVNSIFKDHWQRPRPRSTIELGGEMRFLPVLAYEKCRGPAHSFPSGHSSVGFAPLALWLIWRRRRPVLAVRNGHAITSLFCISASARLCPFFNHKSSKENNYSCAFAQSERTNTN